MTKKILALLLALIMVFSMVACSSDDADDEDDDKEKTEEKADGDEDEDKDDDDADKGDKDDEDKVPEYEAYDGDATNSGDGYYVDPVVLVDDDFTVAVTGISYPDDYNSDYYLAYINFEITNNTDEAVYFSSNNIYINGLSIDSGLYAEAEPGATVAESLDVYMNCAEKSDIEAIQSVALSFYAYTMEDYENVYETDIYTFYTEGSEDYEQNMDFGGEKIMERAGITVYYLGYEVLDDGDVEIDFFVENNTGRTVYLYDEEFYVNDMDLSDVVSGMSCTIDDGYARVNTASLYSFNYEDTDFDPEDIESFKIVFSAWDDETYKEIIPYTDPETAEFDA